MGYPKRLALQLTVQLIRKDRKGRVSRLLSVNPGRDPLIETIKSSDAPYRWFGHLYGVSFGLGKGWGEIPVCWNCKRPSISMAGARQAKFHSYK